MPQACFYLLCFISACSAQKVTTKIKKFFVIYFVTFSNHPALID